MRRILQLDIVLFAIGFAIGAALAAEAAACAAIGAVASAAHRARFGVWSVLPLGFFAATLIVATNEPAPQPFDSPTDVLLRGELIEGPRNLGRSVAWQLRVREVDERPVDFDVRLFGDPGVAIASDAVEVFARCTDFAPAEFPYDHGDRARWAAKGIAARCSAREPITVLAAGDGPRRVLTERRLSIERRLHEVLGRDAGVPIAMLTGTRGLVTESERRAHQRAGTAHLLAISGVHFGALAGIAWFFALFVMRRIRPVTRGIGARRASAGFVLLTMLAYLLFVGAPISAVRAFVAVGSLVVALLVGRRASGVAAVSLAATLLLASSPALVWDLGFQLSFAATIAIVLFWQRLPPALEHDPYAFEQPTRARRAAANVARFILMSWAATAATAPILAATLGELSVISFLTNLVAVPLVSLLIFPMLLAGTALLELVPALGEPIVWCAAHAMLRLSILMEDLASLPGAVLTPGVTGGWWALVVLLCVLGALASRLAIRPVLVSALVAAAASVVAFWPAEPVWRLHFIPVGQGDATLVESPRGERILIDAGGSMFGRDPGLAVVVPYLRRVGVSKLDAVIVTHGDTDHAGGVPAVLEHVEVARLVMEPEDLGVPELTLERWTTEGSRNDRSIVTTLRIADAVVLLPGDVEADAEQQWAPHRVHVLKVAHHGSKTSTSAGFVEAAAPLVSVVSAGRHNRFGHPHPAVVRRLRARGSAVWSTADHGLVVVEITTDGVIRSRSRRIR